MSGQRARPSIPAEHRSAHPNIPGVPWWGAVVIAVVAPAIGFAFDLGSGGGDLTGAFSTLYVLGCLAAVLAVRQAALFTAVIQPPLILFVMVPGSYYLMHSSDIHGIKDILINCGYPLIERFPLMFFTSLTVLLVGAARWYWRASSGQGQPAADEARYPGSGLAAKLTALLGSASASRTQREPRRRHSVQRRPGDAPNAADRAARAARGGRPVKRAGPPPRSRHARPPNGEFADPVTDMDRPRPRRPRPNDSMPPDPRRRPRPASSQRDPRRSVPPGQRREAYDPAERRERPQPRRRYEGRDMDHEPLEPHRSPGSGSHHPISRVRYRGADDAGGQPEYRTRGRSHRRDDADRWEYDI